MPQEIEKREIRRASSLFPVFAALGLALLLAACASRVGFPSASHSRSVMLSGHLYRPEGEGPFPAMVLHHGCGGPGRSIFGWASWLRAEGYVALVVDSFSPRGITNVCERRGVLRPGEVVLDALGALAYLRSLDFVDPDRIGVIGWSFGGRVALLAGREMLGNAVHPPADGFRAAVAFYPSCSGGLADDIIPLLLLLGEADDWTPAAACVEAAKRARQQGRTVLWTVYPLAYHAFDVDARRRVYLGHYMEYNHSATRDAEKQVRAFLAQYLRGGPPSATREDHEGPHDAAAARMTDR